MKRAIHSLSGCDYARWWASKEKSEGAPETEPPIKKTGVGKGGYTAADISSNGHHEINTPQEDEERIEGNSRRGEGTRDNAASLSVDVCVQDQ